MDLPEQFTPANMPRRRPDHTTSACNTDPDAPYTLSGHAAQQARSKGWSEDDVLHAANHHEVAYENGRYPDQMRHIRGDIVAVVHPASKKVVTVYRNVAETDLRSDQTDSDAQRYGRGRT